MPSVEERIDELEKRIQELTRVRLPRWWTPEFVSEEPPTDDDVLQWDDTAKKWRPTAASGAMKTQSSGYFTIPAMPSVGTTVTKSGTADTWGSWTAMIASTSAAIYIVGIRIRDTAANAYVALDIGTGAGGAEASIGYTVMSGEDTGTDSGVRGQTVMLPHAIPVATATRIACRTAGSRAAADNIVVTLICVNQADLVSL